MFMLPNIVHVHICVLFQKREQQIVSLWREHEQQRYLDIIAERSSVPTENNPLQCRLWKSPHIQYPRIRVVLDGLVPSTSVLVHRLVFYNQYNSLVTWNPHWQVSHLCHNKLCISTAHLNLEPAQVNICRRICQRHGQCIHHIRQPDCLFTA